MTSIANSLARTPQQRLTNQEKITFQKPTALNIIIQYLEEFNGKLFGTHNIEDIRRFGESKYHVSHNVGTYDRKWRVLRSMQQDPHNFVLETIGKRFVYDKRLSNGKRENYFWVTRAETNLFGEVVNGRG